MAQEKDFICVTTDTVPGRNIRQVLGLVWSSDSDISDAYAQLESAAKEYGANAVVGTKIDTVAVAQDYGATVGRRYTFYGTAVILEE